MCDDNDEERQLEMMEIVEHLIKTNQNKRWDLLENEAFIMVIILLMRIIGSCIHLYAFDERHRGNA